MLKFRLLFLLCVLLAGSVSAGAAGKKKKKSAKKVTVTQYDKGKFDYFFLEAMIQRGKENHAAAYDLLQHCISINPESAEAYYYLAQYYLWLRDKDKAMECFKKAADLCPDNHTYLETLAQSYITNNDYAEATATLEALVKLDGSREDVLEMLVNLYQQDEESYPKAIVTLEKLEAIDGKNGQLTYMKSQLYTRMGMKEEAVEEARELAEQYPNDLSLKGLYGGVLLMNDMNDEAFKVYDEVLKEDPDNRNVLMSLRGYYNENKQTESSDSITMILLGSQDLTSEDKIGLLREAISQSEATGGDSTKVLAFFNQALKGEQEDGNIGLLCAVYMELKKMPNDSINRVLEQVLAVAPDNAAARLRLVGEAWRKNNMARVIELCAAARQYNPEEMAFYYYQGMAHYRNDDSDKALEAFQNGISVINSESDVAIVSDFYAVMGDLLHSKGKEQEAYAAYDSCLSWKPDNYGCLNNYAYYLSLNGKQLDKAEQMSYKTVKAEPKNATYLDTYAWILFMQERYAEAKIYIEQAVQNDADSSAVIIEHAGDIAAMNNDMNSALDYWKRASAKAPENSLLRRKIKLKKYIKE